MYVILGVPSVNVALDALDLVYITVKTFSRQFTSFRYFAKLVGRETFFLPFLTVYVVGTTLEGKYTISSFSGHSTQQQ